MSLVQCPECGKEVSVHADTCPNCGYPIISQKQTIWGKIEGLPKVIIGRNVTLDGFGSWKDSDQLQQDAKIIKYTHSPYSTKRSTTWTLKAVFSDGFKYSYSVSPGFRGRTLTVEAQETFFKEAAKSHREAIILQKRKEEQ